MKHFEFAVSSVSILVALLRRTKAEHNHQPHLTATATSRNPLRVHCCRTLLSCPLISCDVLCALTPYKSTMYIQTSKCTESLRSHRRLLLFLLRRCRMPAKLRCKQVCILTYTSSCHQYRRHVFYGGKWQWWLAINIMMSTGMCIVCDTCMSQVSWQKQSEG